MSVLISVPIVMAISQYSNLNHACDNAYCNLKRYVNFSHGFDKRRSEKGSSPNSVQNFSQYIDLNFITSLRIVQLHKDIRLKHCKTEEISMKVMRVLIHPLNAIC